MAPGSPPNSPKKIQVSPPNTPNKPSAQSPPNTPKNQASGSPFNTPEKPSSRSPAPSPTCQSPLNKSPRHDPAPTPVIPPLSLGEPAIPIVRETVNNAVIRPAGSKGLGLFAAKKLSRGDLVCAEEPFLIVEDGLKALKLVTEESGEEKWHAFWDLTKFLTTNDSSSDKSIIPSPRERMAEGGNKTEANTVTAEDFVRKNLLLLCTNRGPMSRLTNKSDEEGEGKEKKATPGGIFKILSRVNHSCVPNAAFSWYENERQGRLYALDKIDEGEEVVIDYLGGIYSIAADKRTKALEEALGIGCSCEICTNKQKSNVLIDLETLENKLIASGRNLQADHAEELALVWRCFEIHDFLGIPDMRRQRTLGNGVVARLRSRDRWAAIAYLYDYAEACNQCLGKENLETMNAHSLLDGLETERIKFTYD